MKKMVEQILEYKFSENDLEFLEKEYNPEEIKKELAKTVSASKNEIANILYKYFLYTTSEYLHDESDVLEFEPDGICEMTEKEFLSISKKEDFLKFVDVVTIATSIDEVTKIPMFIIDIDTKWDIEHGAWLVFNIEDYEFYGIGSFGEGILGDVKAIELDVIHPYFNDLVNKLGA